MLKNIVLSYRELLDHSYCFQIAKTIKGTTQYEHIMLDFSEGNFYHLAGLHKISGVTKLRVTIDTPTTYIYNQILAANIDYSDLDVASIREKKSFLTRATSIPLLFTLLNQARVTVKGFYRFNQRKAGSNICARHFIQFKYRQQDYYLFLDKKEKKKNYVRCYPVSQFRKNPKKSYEKDQQHEKLIRIWKISKSKNISELIYGQL